MLYYGVCRDINYVPITALKRQFDANPRMAKFKSTACLQSTEFNFEYVAIERGNSLHFSTSGCGAGCCIIELVKA